MKTWKSIVKAIPYPNVILLCFTWVFDKQVVLAESKEKILFR